MIIKTNYNFIKINSLFIGIVLWSAIAHSQVANYSDITDFNEYSEVHWVNQIPPLNQGEKLHKKGWLKRLILGKDDLTNLQKPVMAIRLKNLTTVILDQGLGTVFLSKDDIIEVPKIFKKQENLFSSLIGACNFQDNKLLITDSGSNKIFQLTDDFKLLNELNKELSLKQPTGIAYSKINNEIWVVETGEHRIVILDLLGNVKRILGNRGFAAGEFNYPTSIWIDSKGTAYIVFNSS
jgi:DNA-binding beta-propeller fold protein YncE